MEMKFEKDDIEIIASTVAENIKPLLRNNSKVRVEDIIFDVKGLAKYLKVDESWIYKQVSFRAIPFFKCGKYTRFKKSAIDNWVDRETVKPIIPFEIVKNKR